MKQLELAFEPTGFEYGNSGARPHGSVRPVRDKATLRHLHLASGKLCYRFVRVRRRSIGISVTEGELEARAPHYVRIAEVEAFIRRKERWIARRLAECRLAPPRIQWATGAELQLLGRTVRLCADAGATRAELLGERLVLPAGDGPQWRRQALEWLQDRALSLFRGRMQHFARVLGLPLPALALSNARTLWGSCDSTGRKGARILLNWRLVQLPLRLTDYVVVHELAHLKEHNHSPRFWAVVALAVPDYLETRRELNRLGHSLAVL